MSRAIPCAVEVVEPSRTDSVMHYRSRLGIWRCPDYDAVERLIADPRADVGLHREMLQVEAWAASALTDEGMDLLHGADDDARRAEPQETGNPAPGHDPAYSVGILQ